MSIIQRWRTWRLEHEELAAADEVAAWAEIERRIRSIEGDRSANVRLRPTADDLAAIANPDDRPPADHRPPARRLPPAPPKPEAPPGPSFADLRVAVTGLGQAELDRMGEVCAATIDWCVAARKTLREARSKLRTDANATQPRKKSNGRRTSSRRDRSGA